MKFLCSNTTWARGISAVQNAVGSPLSNPIVENIFISCKEDKVIFVATNLNLTLRCEGEAKVETPGEVVLPTKIISGIVRDLPQGEVSFKEEKSVVNLKCSEFRAKMNGLDAKIFPPYMPVDEGYTMEIEVSVLKDIIRKTLYSTTQEKSRYELDGVFFDFREGVMNCVSADGRRLTWFKHELEELKELNFSMSVPAKTLQEVSRSFPDEGKAALKFQEKKIQIHCGDTTLVSNLLKNNFPQYEKIVPTGGIAKANVKREEFAMSIQRASNLASMDTGMVILDLEDGNMEALGERQDMGGEGRDRIKVEYAGKKVSIRYNYRFLLDFLKCIDEEEVEIELWDSNKPAIFRGRGKTNYLYVLMPIKPPEEL